jgi:hypothetical protein
MPNLQTLHVLHAHTQMTSQIKAGFEGITLPAVRNLIIPGYCHELLKRCPEARSVRCTREDGSKLVTVIKKSCTKVEEMRGFWMNTANFTKRLCETLNFPSDGDAESPFRPGCSGAKPEDSGGSHLLRQGPCKSRTHRRLLLY